MPGAGYCRPDSSLSSRSAQGRSGLIYAAVNAPVLAEVPSGASSLLDIGCGTGALGRELKSLRSIWVTGLTSSPEEASAARKALDEIVVAELETWDPISLPRRFDVIVCSHVLEHLREPAESLARLTSLLNHGGVLIVAVPNIVHWRQRLAFLRGRFRYTSGGLMDRTHLRFYDWDGARGLLGDGWEVTRAYAVGHAPGVWRLPQLGAVLDRWVCRRWPGLFGDQFIVVGHRREAKFERPDSVSRDSD